MSNLPRALAYLNKLPSANSGAGGHNATLRAACECARFGSSESDMWEAMTWYNLNRCNPAWSEKELRHKILDAQKMTAPTRVQTSQRKARAFAPPVITAKRPARIARRRAVGLPIMDYYTEEAWWANVWRERGLPDPTTVAPGEFMQALKARETK